MPKLEGPLLVVEDVPNVLELLEVTLRFKGYHVVSAHNGVEGLEKVESAKPELIITEILTHGSLTTPEPLNNREFYLGYRDRLEHKLRHKNTQIMRTERLLPTL